MSNRKIKAAGLLAAASLFFLTQPGCGKDGAVSEESQITAEAPETQPTSAPAEEDSNQSPEPGEVQGPGYQEESTPEPEEQPEYDPDHHPEPPPEEEETAEEGTLSPSSETSGIFGGGQNAEAAADPELSNLLSSLPFPSGNGSWSVYVCDLENNTEGYVNEHRMQAASLIKLYIMGAVYENYESLEASFGRENLEACLHSMITVSDNDAANTLTGYLGGGDSTAGRQAVNDYCSRNGYTSTHMGRMLLQSNEMDDNYTSAADCGHFLKRVYDGWMEGREKETAMFELLAAQERRNKIPAQMPEGVSIANKTGELADVENDAGILYYSAHDLVIVFLSENLSEAGSAQNTIAALSRQIYDFYLN